MRVLCSGLEGSELEGDVTRLRIGKDGFTLPIDLGFVEPVWSGVVPGSEMLFLKGKGRGK